MLILKFKTFLKSLWFHISSGLPKSTQEEINYRYSICLACEKFKKNKSECGVCGCNINRKKVFLNKLAWADQECPIHKWSKITR
jgi:uncharacterized paraquat-inducible protein A